LPKGNFSLRENPEGFSSPEKSKPQDFSGSKSEPDLKIKKRFKN
jgi:hypothetical protein